MTTSSISHKRPIGFNGINLAATRPDLLDRGLIIELERIKPENRRRFEQDIKPELERIKPELLGFILDTIVKVPYDSSPEEALN